MLKHIYNHQDMRLLCSSSPNRQEKSDAVSSLQAEMDQLEALIVFNLDFLSPCVQATTRVFFCGESLCFSFNFATLLCFFGIYHKIAEFVSVLKSLSHCFRHRSASWRRHKVLLLMAEKIGKFYVEPRESHLQSSLMITSWS